LWCESCLTVFFLPIPVFSLDECLHNFVQLKKNRKTIKRLHVIEKLCWVKALSENFIYIFSTKVINLLTCQGKLKMRCIVCMIFHPFYYNKPSATQHKAITFVFVSIHHSQCRWYEDTTFKVQSRLETAPRNPFHVVFNLTEWTIFHLFLFFFNIRNRLLSRNFGQWLKFNHTPDSCLCLRNFLLFISARTIIFRMWAIRKRKKNETQKIAKHPQSKKRKHFILWYRFRCDMAIYVIENFHKQLLPKRALRKNILKSNISSRITRGFVFF
jgi:hypothetical protein